ncbi:aminobenzoate oxygenase, partial [Streptomyces europaeiscabiei]
VMQDEARHVAFGRMALRDYYRQLTDAELREREEFVIEGCYLMRDRLRGVEVPENFGISKAEAHEFSEQSEFLHLFRKLLFSRI